MMYTTRIGWTSAVAFLLMGCVSDAPEVGEGLDTGDGNLSSAVATISSEGGQLTLPDGTAFVVPPGALKAPVEFTMTEVPTGETDLEHLGYIPFGSAFTLSPVIGTNSYFEIRLNPDNLPTDAIAEDVIIAESGWMIVEDVGFVDEFIEIPSDRIEDGVVFVKGQTTNGVLQPMVLAPEEGGARRSGDSTMVGGTNLGGAPCGDLVEAYYGRPAPSDMNKRIKVDTGGLRDFVKARVEYINDNDRPNEELEAFVDAVNRFAARSCLGIYRSLVHYESILDFPMPAPEKAGRPHKRLELVLRERSKRGVRASASGEAVRMNFIVGREWAKDKGMSDAEKERLRALRVEKYPGWISSWNAPAPDGADPWTHQSPISKTTAHEVFHWLHDLADGKPKTWGPDKLKIAEPMAVHMADQVFDLPLNERDPARFEKISLWKSEYKAHSLYGFLDWRGSQTSHDTLGDKRTSFGKAFLRIASSQATREEPYTHTHQDYLDTLAQFMGRPSVTLGEVQLEYASAYLFTHDFDRAVPGEPEFADVTPDALGWVIDEEDDGNLWGSWYKAADPEIDTPSQRNHTLASPSSWDKFAYKDLLPGTFIVQEYDLSNFDEKGRIRMILSTETGGNNIAARAYLRPKDGRATQLWQTMSVADTNSLDVDVMNQQSNGGFVPPEVLDGEATLVLILANTDPSTEFPPYSGAVGGKEYCGDNTDNDGDDKKDCDDSDCDDHPNCISTQVQISAYAIDESMTLLSPHTDGLQTLDPENGAVVSQCANDDSLELENNARVDVLRIAGSIDGYVVSYPYKRQLHWLSRGTCARQHVTEMPDGLPGPQGIELTPDQRHIVAALADPNDLCAPGAIAVIDQSTTEVVAYVPTSIGVTDLALVPNDSGGVEAWATLTGDETCKQSGVAIVAIDALVDGLVGAPEMLDPVGTEVDNPRRISVTDSGHWVAWATGDYRGRIVVVDTLSRSYQVFQDDEDHIAPWEDIVDVVALDHEASGGVQVYFLTTWSREIAHIDTCDSGGATCSGIRWLQVESSGGDWLYSGDRTLRKSHAKRIGITPDQTMAWVSYEGSNTLSVWSLGYGGYEHFIHSGELDTIYAPIAILPY